MPSPARYRKRLAAGLCGTCGGHPHLPGQIRCATCKAGAIADAAKRAEWALANGLCRVCLGTAEPGRSHCDRHLGYYRKRWEQSGKGARAAAKDGRTA